MAEPQDHKPLEGIDIVASKYLPKTVLDKDGNEVELLGILRDTPPALYWYGATLEGVLSPEPDRIVLLTGKVVRRAVGASPAGPEATPHDTL